MAVYWVFTCTILNLNYKINTFIENDPFNVWSRWPTQGRGHAEGKKDSRAVRRGGPYCLLISILLRLTLLQKTCPYICIRRV